MPDEKDKSSSATHEPWKEPGQTSQDAAMEPPKDVVEQQRRKKGIKPGEPNPLKPA
jgi:hypothetical protein